MTEARDALQDTASGNYRWTEAELLRYVNGSTRQILLLLPESNPVEYLFTTVAGSRQTLPTDGIKFIKATHNYGGGARTTVIKYVEEDVLNSLLADWPSDTTPVLPGTTSTWFQHYSHDPREPKIFSLYPAPDIAGRQLYIVYSQMPTKLTAKGQTYPLDDVYANAAIEYIVYRALTKEGRYSLPSEFRVELWNNFLRGLGFKVQSEARVSPDANRPPEGA